jgi:CheY-like chemotaxis protein
MPRTTRALLDQISDLQAALEGFSFENLSSEEALKLKRNFDAFKERIEQHVWNPEAAEANPETIQSDVPREMPSRIAAIGQELHTPLNEIIGFTDRLQGGSLDESQVRCVEAIRSASQSMLGFMKQLMDQIGGKEEVKTHTGPQTKYNTNTPTLPAAGGIRKASGSAETPGRLLEGKRVMVFEDNPLNMKLIETRLKTWGCEVVPVLKVPYGLSLLHECEVDLILMDLRMPEMDGYEATRQIRQHSNLTIRTVPIIAVTADLTANDGEKCKKAGIDDMVLKPYTADELAATLSRHLKLDKIPIANAPGKDRDTTTTRIVSLDVLWEECDGDFEMMEQMVVLFRANLLEFLGNLKTNIQEPNYLEIRAAAHKVKAGVKLLKAQSWLKCIERIQQLSREEQGAAEIRSLYEELRAGYSQMELGLKESLESYKKNPENGN